MTRYAILDQSAASMGRSHHDTLHDTIALAQHCERLGYHRFWLAEHHNSPANVGTAPEIMCAAIASVTRTIRVGSAGVLLSHYAPLKVAEQFRVLSALAPGRIDLGIGRSPGGSPATQAHLNRGVPPREHAEQVRELLHWLSEDAGAESIGVLAYPRGVTPAMPWMLGSSTNGAALAARFGLPFCFNYSHGSNFRLVGQSIAAYRAQFKPSAFCAAPLVSLSIWVLAAETEEEAEFLLEPRLYWRVMLDRGVRVPMVPPTMALTESYSLAEQARLAELRQYSIVGAATDVAARIDDVRHTYDADEIVLATWTHDPADRLRSCQLLAGQFGLRHSPAAA